MLRNVLQGLCLFDRSFLLYLRFFEHLFAREIKILV